MGDYQLRNEKHRKIRVLLSKSKMDVHDRGIRYVARKMLEAGLEVILTRHGLMDEVANIALQEDIDVIGLSFSGGGHLSSCLRLKELLKGKGIEDKMVIVGGVIPEDDIPELKKIGVVGVFGAGSRADEAIQFIKSFFGQEC
jgi:methylmalonyl-CoA mutase C-terminal domain/subunit